MKCYLSAVCAVSVLVALACAAPMPQNDQDSGTAMISQTAQIVNGINSKIMLLRQFCPQLFQVIDNVIQNVTSVAFRVIGRAVLQSGGLGGGGGSANGGGESRVSVVLPTFGPDDDDYDDDDEETKTSEASSTPTTQPSVTTTTTTTTTITTTTTTTTTTASPTTAEETLEVKVSELSLPSSENEIDTAPVNEDDTLYTSPASRTKRDVRTIRAAEDQDQDVSASGGNGPNPSDDLSNVEIDDADRDKRFLPAGGSFGVHAGGSAGGGSGNFLFDIIRRTADGAARAAGTVYRMIAGTENVGLGLTATSTSSRVLTPQLIAGSGATEETDEKENAPLGAGGVAEIDVAKSGDGLTEGIPGPITRLFVLANRGLANLVQDLILRLAQTSERIVNFKARLITALI